MSMNGKGGGDSTGLGKRKINYQQQNRTPRKKTNHFNKHRCQRFTYWFKNLKIVTWSVGGMVGETQWRIFVEWVKKENPDVILIQETWAIKMKDIEGYDIAISQAVPPVPNDQGRTTGHAKRGLATYFRNEGDICWKQEGEIEDGAWEFPIVGKYCDDRGRDAYIRIVNGYGPQATEKELVRAQMKRYLAIFKTKLGRDGETVINILGADQNVADTQYGSLYDNDTKQELLLMLEKANMTRVACWDRDEESQVTNYHTTKTAKGVPDVFAISTQLALAGKLMTEIKHTPKLVSGHAHERIEAILPIRMRGVEGVRRKDKKKYVRAGPNRLSEAQWRQVSETMDEVMQKWAMKWIPCFEEAVKKGEVPEMRKQLGKARKEMYDNANWVMDAYLPRVPSALYKSGSEKVARDQNERDRVWETVIKAESDEEANKMWVKFQELQDETEQKDEDRQDELTETLVRFLQDNMRDNPKGAWSMQKRLGAKSRVSPPEQLWQEKDGTRRIVTDEGEVAEIWSKAMSRKTYPQKGTKWDEEGKRNAKREIGRHEEALRMWKWIERDEEGHVALTWKEFKKDLASLNSVAPGPSTIGGEIVKKAGEGLQRALYAIVRRSLELGVMASETMEDIVSPVHKRNNPAIESNYRPVSMTDEDNKLMKKILKRWITKWEEEKKGGPHPSSFGAKKNRDIQMVLVTAKETVLMQKFRKRSGKVALIVADVKSAFPSLSREGLAKKFLDRGMPNWLWKRWWMTVKKLRGRIRIGNIHTDMTEHEEGVNQGDVMAAEEWGWFFQDLADDLQATPDGEIVTVGDSKWKPSYLYVDDASILVWVPEEEVQKALMSNTAKGKTVKVATGVTKVMRKFAEKNCLNWAKPKLKVMVFGVPEKVQKQFSVNVAGEEKAGQSEIELLGDVVEADINSATSKFVKTTKAMRKVGSKIAWTCSGRKMVTISTMKLLIESLIVSRIRSGLVTHKVRPSQMKTLDAIMAEVVKATLGLPTAMSSRLVLIEMGMRDAETILEHEMLRLFGRVRRKTAGDQVKNVFMERRKDIEAGETEGFFARVVEILKSERMMAHFEKDTPEGYMRMSQEHWKKHVNRVMEAREKRRMEQWVKENGLRNNDYERTKRKWGQETYITRGSRADIARKMAFRGGAWSLRGNKTESRSVGGERKDAGQEGCRWCDDEKAKETEKHLVEECSALRRHRERWEGEIDKERGKQWRRWGDEQQSAKMREMKGVNNRGGASGEKGVKDRRQGKGAEAASRKLMSVIEQMLKKKTGESLMGPTQGQFGTEDSWRRRQLDLDYADIVDLIEKDYENE